MEDNTTYRLSYWDGPAITNQPIIHPEDCLTVGDGPISDETTHKVRMNCKKIMQIKISTLFSHNLYKAFFISGHVHHFGFIVWKVLWIFKEDVSLYPQLKMKKRVFRILPNAMKMFQKSIIRKVVRTLIWHINNSKKLLTNK